MATLGSNSVIKVKVSSTGGLSPTSTPLTLKNVVAPDRFDRLTDVDASNETNGAVPVYDSNTGSYVVRTLGLNDVGLSVTGANNSGVLAFNEDSNTIISKLLNGTSGEIEIAAGNTSITFGLPDDITVANSLQTNVITSNTVNTGNLNVSGTIDRNPNINIILTGDVTGTANGTLTNLSNVTITVNTTVTSNGVQLGTDTTGSYVANISGGTGVSISNTSGGETEVPVISIGQDVATTANVTFNTVNATAFNVGSTLTSNSNQTYIANGNFAKVAVTGQTTLAQTSVTANLTVRDIIPEANNVYNLGSPENRFQTLYLSGNTLYVGNVVFEDTTSSLGITDSTGNPINLNVGNTSVNGTLSVASTLEASDLSANNLTVTGVANISNIVVSNINAVSNVTVSGKLTVTNTAAIGNTTVAGFANISGNTTVGGTLTAADAVVTGNLTVSGTTTYINTTQLNVGDNIITLNADVTGSATENAGIEIERGTDPNVTILWDEVDNKWKFNNDGSTYYQFASNTDVSTAYSNATSYADTKAAAAYSNAVTTAAADATTKAATAYSNATSYADTKAATAYSNATSYADTKAATAYSNAVSVAAADATAKADAAYSNAVSVAATDATNKASNAYSNAVSVAATDATNKAANAYSNAVSYADTKAATAYTNAVSVAATDATNKAATAYGNAITYAATIAGTAYSNATAYADAKAANAYSNAVSFATDAAANAYSNAVSVASADATSKAATAYSNATSYADTKAAAAYSNAVSYTDAKAANAYSNAVSYADTVAATAYTNAVSYADTKAGQAYTNAVSVAATDATNKADTAYSNGVSYTDGVATTTYNNATGYANTKAGQAYTNAVSYTDAAVAIKANTANPTFTGNVTANVIHVNAYIDFSNTAAAPSKKEGRLFYDNASKTMAYHVEDPDITMNMGQELWTRVYNNTGSTITDGSAVYITGATGGVPTIALADATDSDKMDVIGLATHSIEDGTYGYVTAYGRLSPVDTTGMTVGDKIYVSTTPGGITTVAPTYPNWAMHLGEVMVVGNSTTGTVLVDLEPHFMPTLRVGGPARIDGDLTITGDLTLLGNTTSTSVNNLEVGNTFIYLSGGDSSSNAAFTGSGLNDVDWNGRLEYSNTTTFYVKIVSAGGTDTFAWSKDNFATVEANNISITGDYQSLGGGMSIKFEATTGHTLNDKWSATLTPINLDTGIIGNYHTGENGTYTHSGYFRDASDNKFKFFKRYDAEPGASIDTSNATFQLGDIVANTFTGDLTGDVTGNADTATALATARKIQLIGDVTGNVNFDGSTNVQIATTIGTLGTSLTISNTLSTGNTTITGTLAVSGNATFDTNTLFVDATNNRVGIKTIAPTAPLTIGSGGATLTTPAVQVTDSQNSYIQVALQNLSNGTYASADYVITADNGTDLTNYLDLGLASSAYDYPDFNIIQPLDGYLYNQGGRMLVGTGANKDIVFFTGNVVTGSERAYIYANGDVKFLGKVVVNNSITATTLTANIDASNIVSGTISNSRLNAANTTQAGVVQLVDSVTNTSITIAATANSVKAALALAVANAASAYTNAASYADTVAATAYTNAVATASSDASTKAATAYSNAASYADTKAATAYSNATSYADTVAATAYSNAVSYTDAKAANAYSNAVSYADTKAATAYSNAVSVAATDATSKADAAYSNAVSYADTKAATAYSNAVSYADTKAATAYSNATAFAANATNISSGTVANARLNAANTTQAGIVQLVDSTSNVSVTHAATANSVKTALELAVANAATAYTNAVAYAASNTYVNNTFAPLAGATFTGAVVVGNTIASGNATITGYANISGNAIVGGTLSAVDVAVSGNLTVSGTTTYINTTTLNVGDNIITLNADLSNGTAPSENVGIEVNRGSAANVTFRWNETSDEWQITANGTAYYAVATNTDVSTAYSNAASYADTKAATAYSNAVSVAATDATDKAANAYSNAVSYADVKAANAYSNAIAYSSNADNISSGTVANARLNAANTTQAGIVQLVDSYTNTSIVVAPTANALNRVYQLAVSAGGAGAADAYNNAVAFATSVANDAYTNAAAFATSVAATAYANAVSDAESYSDTAAAAAYTNAVAYAASNTYVNNTFAPKADATFTGNTTVASLFVGNTIVNGTVNVSSSVNAANLNISGTLAANVITVTNVQQTQQNLQVDPAGLALALAIALG